MGLNRCFPDSVETLTYYAEGMCVTRLPTLFGRGRCCP
ncbi:hypothetical protein J2129_001463 [Methanofollis sp. W23]|nr:hypothetical protein [Methanofollis sp. W23]